MSSEAAAVQSSQYKVKAKREVMKQIQLKFSLMKMSGEQEERFPLYICVRVNGRLYPFPIPVPTSAGSASES